MTNKEIEKRFLFDLEMGAFTQYTDTMIFHNRNYLDELQMKLLLKNIGFKSDNTLYVIFGHRLYETTRSKPSIMINTKSKAFSNRNIHVTADDYEKYFNELPDYIKEYKVHYKWLIKKLKRNFSLT